MIGRDNSRTRINVSDHCGACRKVIPPLCGRVGVGSRAVIILRTHFNGKDGRAFRETHTIFWEVDSISHTICAAAP